MESGTPAQPQAPAETKPATISLDWKGVLTEGTKIAFLALFVLYAIGFIIWHSYLANFGVSTVEFLQTEYLAAAICYLFLLIVFALPTVIIIVVVWFREKFQGFTLIALSLLWYYLATQVSYLYFPTPRKQIVPFTLVGTFDFNNVVFRIILYIALFHFIVLLLLLRLTSRKNPIYNVLANPNWLGVYFMFIPLISFFEMPGISKTFIFSTIVLYPIMAMASTPTFSHNGIYLSRNSGFCVMTGVHPTMRILIGALICLMLICNITMFGVRQFGFIPRTVGGGETEVGTILLADNDHALAVFLSNKEDRSDAARLIGPVEILLRTDKKIIFLDAVELQRTNLVPAREVRADLVEAVLLYRTR
jgi:hypothetical protein